MEEKKEKEPAAEIDLGLGKFSLGGIFDGLANLIDQAGKVAQQAQEIKKEGEFKIKGLGDKARGVFGFTIRTLGEGRPIVERFGNIRETQAGPVVEEVREPIVDVFDEADAILVVVELPGVSEDAVRTDVKGDILIVTAEEGQRKYSKEVLLPAVVDPETLSSVYKNGVLELKVKKAQGS